jgi:hypothetical protein
VLAEDDHGDVGLDGRAPAPMLSSGTTTAGALRAGAAVDRMSNRPCPGGYTAVGGAGVQYEASRRRRDARDQEQRHAMHNVDQLREELRALLASWEYAFAMGHGCSIGGHPDHRAIRRRAADLRARISELTD